MNNFAFLSFVFLVVKNMSCQDLPLEVLIKIFAHLERHTLFNCFLVSRHWNRAAQDNLLKQFETLRTDGASAVEAQL